jgi:hypothetical protein
MGALAHGVHPAIAEARPMHFLRQGEGFTRPGEFAASPGPVRVRHDESVSL